MKTDQFRHGIFPIRVPWCPFAVQKSAGLFTLLVSSAKKTVKNRYSMVKTPRAAHLRQ